LGINGVVGIDPLLDGMINSLVPPFREASSPIPLPTFLGKEFFNVSELSGAIGVSSSSGETAVKDLAWSRGLRLEVSPIKTRSARKKLGTNLSFSAQHLETHLEQGALRGMKSLARENHDPPLSEYKRGRRTPKSGLHEKTSFKNFSGHSLSTRDSGIRGEG
jgi:hypothetical protein